MKLMRKTHLKNMMMLSVALIIGLTSFAQESIKNSKDLNLELLAGKKIIAAGLESGKTANPVQNISNYEESNGSISANNEIANGDKDMMSSPMQLVFSFPSAGSSIDLELWGTVNCTVDWGDGTATENFTTEGTKPHTYASAGTYTLEISGSLDHFGRPIGSWVGVQYLTHVLSFGDLGLTSLQGAFSNADNLIGLPIVLPSTVTSLNTTFSWCSQPSFPNIELWDVSHVTNMRGTFFRTPNFNQDITNWDMSNVTTTRSMFGYSGFNQPIGNWDMGNVIEMVAMFSSNTVFNQPIGNWDVSNVNDMSVMFYHTTGFNQPLDNWDVSNVTNFAALFEGASSFDQNIGNWDVSNATDMGDMFKDITLSTQNYTAILSGWGAQDVQNGIDFDGGNSKYSASALPFRNILTGAPKNWTITDGGMVPSAIDWANLSSPENALISFGDNLNVYGEVYADGYTNGVGQSSNIQAWIGWNETNTNPATWTNWAPAVYHSDNGNNDQYVANLGNILLLQGQPSNYYYAMRYQFDAEDYIYGGYSGGLWDGVTNVSGYLQMAPTIPLSNWAFALIGLLAVGVVYIRFRK